MRWMFAKHKPVQNLNFGYGPAAEIKKVLLTLWNVYSFFVTYANIDEFDPCGKTLDENNLTRLDRWLLSRINTLILNCDKSYENYDTVTVVKEIEGFFDDFSNWYVRRNRRRFWKSENDEDKLTAYLVLYECLVKLIKVIAPTMPFLTENIYQNLVASNDKNAPESIHLCDFPVVEQTRIDNNLEKTVALTRRVVSLGRAARSKANIKIRQPLGELIISLPEDSTELTGDDRKIILEELNIKKLTLSGSNELDRLFTYTVSPVFGELGPKFGARLNSVVKWIKTISQDEIDKFLRIKSLKRELDGKTVEITEKDVEVKEVEKKGWCVVRESDFGVAIDTHITDGLEKEGMVREFIHKVQNMRKEADFNLVDRIRIEYDTNEKLRETILENLEYIKKETLAIEVSEGKGPGEITKTLNINGIEAGVSLKRRDLGSE